MRTKTLPVLAFSLLGALLAAGAHGEDFLFSFEASPLRGGPFLQGSGVLVGDSLGGNEWQITAASGTMGGLPLMLSGATDQGIPDNILYTGAGSGGYRMGFPFDLSGLGLSNGQLAVILDCGSISYTQPDCEMFTPTGISGLNFTFTQVPEPATFGLLSVGLALLALRSLRRRDSLLGHRACAVAGT